MAPAQDRQCPNRRGTLDRRPLAGEEAEAGQAAGAVPSPQWPAACSCWFIQPHSGRTRKREFSLPPSFVARTSGSEEDSVSPTHYSLGLVAQGRKEKPASTPLRLSPGPGARLKKTSAGEDTASPLHRGALGVRPSEGVRAGAWTAA